MRQYDYATGPTTDPDPATVLDRLAASLGAEPIRDMVDRFAVMLSDAVTALERGDAGAVAHRVAGLAGTLGFAAAARAWLRMAEGDAIPSVIVAEESHSALATIARWQLNSGAPATSV